MCPFGCVRVQEGQATLSSDHVLPRFPTRRSLVLPRRHAGSLCGNVRFQIVQVRQAALAWGRSPKPDKGSTTAYDQDGTVDGLCWLVSSSAGSQAPLPPPRGSVIITHRDPVSRSLSQAFSTACERGCGNQPGLPALMLAAGSRTLGRHVRRSCKACAPRAHPVALVRAGGNAGARCVRCSTRPRRGRGSSPPTQPRLAHRCGLKPDASSQTTGTVLALRVMRLLPCPSTVRRHTVRRRLTSGAWCVTGQR